MIDEDTVAAAVAAVRAYLRVEGTAEQAVLARAVASAVLLGEGYTRCVFVRRTVEERVAASSGWMLLDAEPVVAIEAVLGANGVALSVDAYAVDIDAAGRGWVRLTGAAQVVTVRYAAGLAQTWDALDAPLAQGCVLLAAHLFEARDAKAMPPAAVAALWRPFRRMRLAFPERAA